MSSFYTVGAQFAGTNQIYTYKVDKSIGLSLDDFVVVKPRGNYAVAKVMRVDYEDSAIDPKAPFEYQYIVQKVDSTLFDELTS